MTNNEISVPKEIRQFMLDGAQETFLGLKKNAIKQYRYGNLHIREYENTFLVHMDKKDPRKDHIGHLLCDAPEILTGLLLSFFGGKFSSCILKNGSKNSKNLIWLISAVVLGYVGYDLVKKLK